MTRIFTGVIKHVYNVLRTFLFSKKKLVKVLTFLSDVQDSNLIQVLIGRWFVLFVFLRRCMPM